MYPDATIGPHGTINESSPPRSSISFVSEKVTMWVGVVESLDDQCFVPTTYKITSNNEQFEYFVESESMKSNLYPIKMQFEAGIEFDKLTCPHELVLVQKYDVSPACVTLETKSKLIERGWTKEEAQNKSVQLPLVFDVLKNETTYNVEYDIQGGTIRKMAYGNDTNSILATLDTINEGVLTVSLPRDPIDAKLDYCPPRKEKPPDDFFVVIVNGEEVAYDEIKTTPVKRTLQIPFPDNTKEIEIIATCLI